MEYRIHTNNDDGISEFDIQKYTHKTAEALGLEIYDYDVVSIAIQLSCDSDFEQLAQDTYTPYPIHDNWCDEYKKAYQVAIEERSAPGTADIPNEVVYKKIYEILEQKAKEVVPPRRAKQEADRQEREQIMSKIASVETKAVTIEDEGGRTVMYQHKVTMQSGTVYEFQDRNIFDFGRVINPKYSIAEGVKPGGLCSRDTDGDYIWQTFNDSKGWVPVRPLTEEETFAYLAVSKYCGHCNCGRRM